MTRRAPSEGSAPGFTLIEVMIAVMILSMMLSMIFGSNIGAAHNASHARYLTRATLMARCRMTEVEAYLVKNQLPATDTTVEDPPDTGGEACCTDGVTCEAKVERVELPAQSDVDTAAGDQLLSRAAGAASGTSFGGGSAIGGGGDGGVFGSLASAMGATSGNSSGGLSGSGAPSPRAMAGTMLTTVYPTIKPMLEGAIRRLTVSVRWSEGSREHSFDVVEYVTNPGQTLPADDPTAQDPSGGPGGGPIGAPGGGPGGGPGGFFGRPPQGGGSRP